MHYNFPHLILDKKTVISLFIFPKIENGEKFFSPAVVPRAIAQIQTVTHYLLFYLTIIFPFKLANVSILCRIASNFSAIVLSNEYVQISGGVNPSNLVAIFRITGEGTITSSIPTSIENGTRTLLMWPSNLVFTPGYFLSTVICSVPFTCRSTKSFSVSTAQISS